MALLAPGGGTDFSILAEAFSGAAKGAHDFAQLKMRRDQMAQQQSQFDQQLALNFTKLNEQIRQFDISAEMKERMQKEANALQATLSREEMVSAEKRTGMQARATRAAAAMRAREQRRIVESRERLNERNFSLQGNLNIGVMSGIETLGERPGDDDAAGQAAWDQSRSLIAQRWARGTNLSEDAVTEEQNQKALMWVDNYSANRAFLAEQTLESAKMEALSRGRQITNLGDVSVSPTITLTNDRNLTRIVDGNIVETASIPDDDWMPRFLQAASDREASDPALVGLSNQIKSFNHKFSGIKHDVFSTKNFAAMDIAIKRLERDIDESPLPRGIKESYFENVENEAVHIKRTAQPGFGTIGDTEVITGGATGLRQKFEQNTQRQEQRNQGLTDKEIISSEESSARIARNAALISNAKQRQRQLEGTPNLTAKQDEMLRQTKSIIAIQELKDAGAELDRLNSMSPNEFGGAIGLAEARRGVQNQINELTRALNEI